MSCLFKSVILAVTATFLLTVAKSTLTKEESEKLGGKLTNMLFYKGKVYIGGTNYIYMLNKDLTVNASVNTCDGSVKSCGNDNKVLVLDKNTDQLVICGTGNQGSCKVYNASSLVMLKSKTDLKVSTDSKRPALGMITKNGNLMVAVTYGDGKIDKSENDVLTYEYAISTRKLPDLFRVGTISESKVLNLAIQKGNSLEDYLIYYKSAFQYEEYSYFVTIQKKIVGSNEYVSKLVRICQNDTAYYSYVDIPLGCEKNGKVYNLIQTAMITELPRQSEHLLFAAFTYGEDPENPTGDTVFCQIRLTELKGLIEDGIKNYTLTCEDPSEKKAERYLKNNKESADVCLKSEADFNQSLKDLLCNTKLQNYANIIINSTAAMTQMYTLESGNGFITALGRAKLENGEIVVLAGTSSGKLIRMNLDPDGSLTRYSKTVVENGVKITAIHQVNDDSLYVTSFNKVYKYNSTNCSEFHTCADTMAGRNPLCGWCVYEGRATRNMSCSDNNHWLSSLTKCIQLELTPGGIPVLGDITEVRIDAKSIPESRHIESYECRFKNGSVVLKDTPAVKEGNQFKCQTPPVDKHTNAVLEFIVASSKITIAEAQFLFYNCSTYEKCGECVSTAGADCSWSMNEPGCKSANTDGIKNVTDCPKLENNMGRNFIPRNGAALVHLKGSNLPNISSTSSTGLKFWCYIPKQEGALREYSVATIINNEIRCNIRIASKEVAKTDVRVRVKYGDTTALSKELDDHHRNNVTVYDCGKLAIDCSHCKALNTTRYDCHWCGSKSRCLHETKCDEVCPRPNITRILPRDGPIQGKTKVTVSGTELGIEVSDINFVKIGGTECDLSKNSTDFQISSNEDFYLTVPDRIVCITRKVDEGQSGQSRQVHVKVNGSDSDGNVTFTYKKVSLTDTSPKFGPVAGGTLLTFNGENLGVGNRHVTVALSPNKCVDAKVIPDISLDATSDVNFTIQCRINTIAKNARTRVNVTKATIKIDGKIILLQVPVNFMFLPNPEIDQVSPQKGTVSGGTGITITGKNMNNTHVAKIEGNFRDEKLNSKCEIQSSTKTVCRAPKASNTVKNMVEEQIKSPRTKRSDCSECIDVEVKVYLDGFEKEFTLTYYRDPSIHPFEEKDKVHLFSDENKKLTIRGEYINLVAQESDVNITIGLETCSVFELKENLITCLAPKEQPASRGSTLPEVNVTIGNYNKRLGFLKYEKTVEMILIIAGAVGGGLLAIIIIGVVFGIYKYKKVGKKAKEYERNLSDMEMEIKRVAREEFLDMHTTMSSVNKNLVEQGFPYHGYQQFACNVMFSVDYLWTEPVVSNGKMTDDERLKANKGMESLELLISNKFFLVSVITTMENEKRFFIREKSNLAGNLCAVLMGRMDYLNEILKLLMTNLVQESSTKKHKTLFRRCESITEKLLSNWLSLCLYPHVKSHSGSPLYLLYMATQKTMESGPIDAVTGDAKYTLSEEKLLKKWSSSVEEDDNHDLKFEAKTLTLNVVVDNGEEIFKCKALDCDTVSQVKSKCLNQIYVNYPASQLPVGADDLALEWHEGFGGALRLRDEDNTSKREGHWVRLNTLAHYNVKDESNMALIDPHSAEINNQEDYVNLANINMEGVCDGSIDSSQPLTPHDEENPHEFEHWHLVKKEEESAKQGKSAIAELYLNRLFTTKQSLMEYMRPLFDLILDHDRCPPPTKFLYDFLDELGEKYKVETDTVHAWKSHSYAIRVWASLMKMPNTLFDVAIPSFMEENLNIISQVFIESFSLASQKFTKDSPSQKLIFHHEMNHYRDRVKEFYKNVKVDSQNSDEFRQYMAEVNRLQQQTNFNKVSALYRFYNQLKPYFEDILENLSKSKEASTLQLDRKLEQVIAIMEEED